LNLFLPAQLSICSFATPLHPVSGTKKEIADGHQPRNKVHARAALCSRR
jgi:hypothetical protein